MNLVCCRCQSAPPGPYIAGIGAICNGCAVRHAHQQHVASCTDADPRADDTQIIVKPVLEPDLDEHIYHADTGLSQSGAKLLLDSPAKYHWRRTQPEQHADHFDLGKAAHRLALGKGSDITVVDAPDWRTKAAREAKAEAHAAGFVPLLTRDAAAVQAMADNLHSHPIAAAYIADGTGQAEVSMFWTDTDTGTPLRARIDWLRNTGRVIVVDLKTTPDASPRAFTRSVIRFRYHLQAAWYREACRTVLGLDHLPPFVFIAQETTPPYEVAVYELDQDAMDAGARLMRRAIETFVRCTETDDWPSYPAAVLSLPAWALNTEETS